LASFFYILIISSKFGFKVSKRDIAKKFAYYLKFLFKKNIWPENEKIYWNSQMAGKMQKK